MTRTYRKWTVIGLALVGLALVAVAASPALAGGCCPTVGPKGADGPTTAPADGKIVNARCPIMGGKLDRENVPASLTRTFAGQKVGFCCGGCPAKWDKLSDEEKTAKLKAAM
jgi:hypothetical protein